MNKTTNQIKRAASLLLAIGGIALSLSSEATQLINFQFNEGTGTNTTDLASGLIGQFGTSQDPLVDYVELTSASPSGQPGDGSITVHGNGFLMAEDSNHLLAITNGPITVESWVYLPPAIGPTPGIVSYGGSYKMGIRGAYQVFTLLGIADITNSASFIYDGEWTHLAAAWNPGEGVYFYVNGVKSFTPYTNVAAARPPLNNLLSLGSEGLANSWSGSIDRVRIHHALLDETQIDSDPANPKPTYSSTLVSYNFNETSFPCTNAIAPALPTMASSSVIPMLSSPVWTNDTPSGIAGDFALSFTDSPVLREVLTVNYNGTPINLTANNTNYTLQTWIKMPTTPLEERRVIYRTDGPAMRIALSINSTRTLHTTISGVADFTTSVAVPNDNRWHHVAVVMEDYARLRFYLDGILRQTVNRTQTGTPNSDNPPIDPRLRIGKESETRYYYGLLDRVIINNNALTNSTLDFPAIPGLATFTTLASHPSDIITNAGVTVTFKGTPTSTSPATYQWRYRSKLADQGTNITGQTSTTLTLNNIAANNEGFYSLVVSNSVGVTESYAARLTLVSSLNLNAIGFEQPKYSPGFLEEQDYWTNDQNGGTVRVMSSSSIASLLEANGQSPNNPVHSGSQALVVSGAGLATTSIRPITGLENEKNVTLDTWIRPLKGTTTGNVFVTLENSAGNRAAAFRIGPAFSIDYGTAIATPAPWQASGLFADPNAWTHLTMVLNYATTNYDFYVDGVKVNTSPIPFYEKTSDRLTQVRVFKGASQVGMILDDLSARGPELAPTLGIRKTGNDVVLFWPSSITGYILESADSLTAPAWGTVSYSVVGNENQASVQPGSGNKFFRLRK